MIPTYLYTEVREINDHFRIKKRDSEYLSEAYQTLGFDKKAERVFKCGGFLAFSHEIEDGIINPDGKLYQANFCKDRLCPTCTWRRSLKIFGQISQIMEILGNDYSYLFLTLTVPNCKPDDLKRVLAEMYKGRTRLFRRKETRIVYGVISVCEITFNRRDNTFHPHLHNILAVSKSYFGREYLRQKDWQRLWFESYYFNTLPRGRFEKAELSDKSIIKREVKDPGYMPGLPIVDVRKVKAKVENDFGSVVAEVAKYSVKSSDYLYEDRELMAEIVKYLSINLSGMRMLSLSGVFREAYQKLNLEDAESDDADLIHINEKWNPIVAHLITKFHWKAGCYVYDDSYIIEPNTPL